MNTFIRLLYALLIAAAVVAFVGVSIYTFYTAPQTPNYPQVVEPVDVKGTAQLSPSANDYQKAFDRYQADTKAYNRNVSIITLVLAVVILASGLWIYRRSDIIGEGLQLGGIGATIYSVIAASVADDRIMRFLAVTLLLASTIVVVYFRFNEKPEPRKR